MLKVQKVFWLASLVSGIACQSTLATTPQAKKSPSVDRNLISAKTFLNTYFQSVINKGTDGTEYWCSQSDSLAQSLFSPRSYKILGSEKRGTQKKPAFMFVATIESSNRGGSPVIKNWKFYVAREDNSQRAKTLPGGWCMALMD